MTTSKPEHQLALSTTRLLIRSMIAMVFCIGSALFAQAQNAQPNDANESWTASTQTSVDNSNPARTTETHTKSGNRSVDKKRVEVLGPDGHYQPDSDTEKETIQVNATTTHTVVRTYRWDANGQRYLMQVTEEDARSSAGGETHVERTTSNSDVNGNLQVVQRAVADTRQTSPDAQETKTTVYLGDGNGGLIPSLKTQELQKRSMDHTVEVTDTTRVPDANGNWEVSEVREKTVKEDGKNRTSEERVLRPDLEGRLSEISRSVGKEAETAAGEKNNTVETYSQDIPGVAGDGDMHLRQRVTTVEKSDSGGTITEQQYEQPTPGNPSDGLQVSAKTKYTVRYAYSGTQQKKDIQTRDASGNFKVVSIETEKSDLVPAELGQKATSDKPK